MKPDFRQLGTGGKPQERGLLGTVLAIVAGSALVVLGFMFSLVILAVVAMAGLLGYSYLWWKTRALRQQLREQMQQQAQHRPHPDTGGGEGITIEGEVIRDEAKRQD